VANHFANRWPFVLALLAAVSLFSCGDDRGPRYVDPLLLPFVEEFEAAAHDAGFIGYRVASSVAFGPDVIVNAFGERGMAACDGDGHVLVAGYMMPLDGEEGFEPGGIMWNFLLVPLFHEIGHCDLRRGHTDGTVLLDGVLLQKSIMAAGPIVVSAEAFNDHRPYYIGELFGN